MIRRYGEPVKDRRYVMRPGAYAILFRAGELLLTHQKSPVPEYQLPGGGIDPGESAIIALHREVHEETGWKIAPPRRLGAYRRFVYMPEYDMWAEKLCHVYLARPVLSHGLPREPGHSAVWSTPKSSLSLLADAGSKAFVRSLFG